LHIGIFNKVYEAIQIGIKAMKEHNVSIEEINTHLKEVDDLVAAQREIDAALGKFSTWKLQLLVEEDYLADIR
jgi:charged multivesicular body protein 7